MGSAPGVIRPPGRRRDQRPRDALAARHAATGTSRSRDRDPETHVAGAVAGRVVERVDPELAAVALLQPGVGHDRARNAGPFVYWPDMMGPDDEGLIPGAAKQ